MMPERMNAVAVAVAVRHAIAGDLDPKRTLDVLHERMGGKQRMAKADLARLVLLCADDLDGELKQARRQIPRRGKGKRSEEHTSELQSLMRISYAVFCLKKKKRHK